MGYKDITKECVDCHQEFTITAGEQEFFGTKGLELPKRCKECRAAKKARNQERENGSGNRDYGRESNRSFRNKRDYKGDGDY